MCLCVSLCGCECILVHRIDCAHHFVWPLPTVLLCLRVWHIHIVLTMCRVCVCACVRLSVCVCVCVRVLSGFRAVEIRVGECRV